MVIVLGKEEFNLLVGKLAELGTQNVMDPDMVCISTVNSSSVSLNFLWQCGSGGLRRYKWLQTHDRYATERDGSLLK